ncbi:MAG TPA: tRNA (adenosine(37)-N6)-threonylcarbamoyltransferase complex ATPase subunit type 1 TsaE, partial [Candidatus Saccharimonadia bacterium]|nr:tRNA (adenosine(37)-N6)-threonylcarbamoyltransferase complex ATPase subunit type 1 TsaE [Candidatus Saccharimonadia bacterium]
MDHTISTADPQATQSVAMRLAKLLTGGEVIELASDLGGGKTTFVQGLAKGLDYTGDVTSPTFVLSRVYKLNSSLELHHYDLYRLGTGGVVGEELAEDLRDAQTITVVEWGAIVENEMPKDRLRIEFRITGDTSRDLVLSSGGPV